MAILEVLAALGAAIGIPLLRAIVGWLNVALEDGVIEVIEWKKLIETIFRIAIPGIAIFFGLNLLGLDINIIAPVLAASIVDWYISAFKKVTAKAAAEEFKVAMVGFMKEFPKK